MIYKAKILDFNQERVSVLLDDGRLILRAKIAFPYRRVGNAMAGIFYHPSKGDTVLVVEDKRGDFIVIPAFYIPDLIKHPSVFESDDVDLVPIDLKYMLEELKTQPGDIVIFGANDNYIRVTSSGYLMLVAGVNRTIYSPHTTTDKTLGSILTIFSNLTYRHYSGSANFEWNYDAYAGHRISLEIDENTTLAKGDLISIDIIRLRQKYLSISLDKLGNILISNKNFTLRVDLLGNINFETRGIINIKSTGVVNIDGSNINLGGSAAIGGIVNTAQFPACFVTGTPIPGSKTCKVKP